MPRPLTQRVRQLATCRGRSFSAILHGTRTLTITTQNATNTIGPNWAGALTVPNNPPPDAQSTDPAVYVYDDLSFEALALAQLALNFDNCPANPTNIAVTVAVPISDNSGNANTLLCRVNIFYTDNTADTAQTVLTLSAGGSETIVATTKNFTPNAAKTVKGVLLILSSASAPAGSGLATFNSLVCVATF